MGKYFGTDGFRGEAGITLTADHAYKVGRFLGWYYNALRERNGDTDVFCQVLFPEKSVENPFFQQGIFPAFSGHYASLRMRACSIR